MKSATCKQFLQVAFLLLQALKRVKAHGNSEANTKQKMGRSSDMNENENLELLNSENVDATTEETTEQVEQITQPEKLYTEEDFNKKLDEVLGKKIARREAKIRKEYDRKYGELESVLKAGTGKEDVAEMTDTFKKFYESKGIHFPQEPVYSERDIEVLAKAEASDIIKSGLDDVIEEVDRLADVGLHNMTEREKVVFRELAEYRKTAEQGKELSKLGVGEEIYNSKEFKDFVGKFSPATSIREIYEIYNKMQPKKEIRTAGSMKNATQTETGVKDFYTRDEALQFTKQDFDKNPALFKAVEKSMLKW